MYQVPSVSIYKPLIHRKQGISEGVDRKGAKSTYNANENAELKTSKMGRNRVITKIVISRTYDRILKHPLGFWKRDERVQFLSISFLSVSRIHSENRCGLRERLWDF
jgi:hypothetical protein